MKQSHEVQEIDTNLNRDVFKGSKESPATPKSVIINDENVKTRQVSDFWGNLAKHSSESTNDYSKEGVNWFDFDQKSLPRPKLMRSVSFGEIEEEEISKLMLFMDRTLDVDEDDDEENDQVLATMDRESEGRSLQTEGTVDLANDDQRDDGKTLLHPEDGFSQTPHTNDPSNHAVVSCSRAATGLNGSEPCVPREDEGSHPAPAATPPKAQSSSASRSTRSHLSRSSQSDPTSGKRPTPPSQLSRTSSRAVSAPALTPRQGTQRGLPSRIHKGTISDKGPQRRRGASPKPRGNALSPKKKLEQQTGSSRTIAGRSYSTGQLPSPFRPKSTKNRTRTRKARTREESAEEDAARGEAVLAAALSSTRAWLRECTDDETLSEVESSFASSLGGSFASLDEFAPLADDEGEEEEEGGGESETRTATNSECSSGASTAAPSSPVSAHSAKTNRWEDQGASSSMTGGGPPPEPRSTPLSPAAAAARLRQRQKLRENQVLERSREDEEEEKEGLREEEEEGEGLRLDPPSLNELFSAELAEALALQNLADAPSLAKLASLGGVSHAELRALTREELENAGFTRVQARRLEEMGGKPLALAARKSHP